ncbi:MAG TPA: hypothetical protein VH207_01610 [Chthoniobacterales bacterium]|jgi:hypothetical protein|nr:hypothetical protein [Chthoniobacterales bacterium]
MKRLFVPALVAVGLLCALVARAADESSGAALAESVWKASGGENWSNVKTIDFTFAVEKEGKTVASAEHHWDVAAQTDRVKWKGKDVTVNLAEPGSDEDAKAAYARWVNDSYWLLAPLKLKDKGTNVSAEGTKEMDGAERDVLRLSFGKVGLTPKDQYLLYIDPATKLVSSWDYMPEPGKSMHATWSDYQKSGGLTLATDHQMGDARIRILGLKVTSES